MVECRTPEQEVGGSKPTAAVLCLWARHFTPRKYWLNTQEAVAPSQHDWKIVDWDVKPQHKQTNKISLRKCFQRAWTKSATVDSCNFTKRLIEKSRECHNHKPQPTPDTKRKRKMTKTNTHKTNKQMPRSTQTSSLFPKRGAHNAKRNDETRGQRTRIIWTLIWFISVFESTVYLKFAKLQYVSSGFRCRVITGSLMRLY